MVAEVAEVVGGGSEGALVGAKDGAVALGALGGEMVALGRKATGLRYVDELLVGLPE